MARARGGPAACAADGRTWCTEVSTVSAPGSGQTEAAPAASRDVPRTDQANVGVSYILVLMLGTCGASMAYISTLAYSLAVRVDQLAPGRAEYLGYLAGLGGAVALLSGPVVGVLSDRVRSRFGRRRPVLVSGALLGFIGLLVLGLAPNLVVLGAGWVLAVLGWGAAMSSIGALQADKLPSGQRGTVAGFNGFAQQSAPVLGVVMAGLLARHSLLLVLVPALVGAVLLMPLLFFADEADTRAAEFDEPLGVRMVFGKYRYDPRRYPDFSWEWLGRFFFFSGLALNTTFLAFLFATRLDVEVAEVAHTVATISVFAVAASTLGAIGGGFLSDRLGRRRVILMVAACVFASGATIYAFADHVAMFIAGAFLTNAGLGAFAAVDQALVFDILPDRRETGRFMAISSIAQTVPRTSAPILAPMLLAVGDSGKNYALLYLVGGALVVGGGLVILLRVKGVR